MGNCKSYGGTMGTIKLHTISDYEAECKRVTAIIAKSSRRAKGGWITYRRRLWKEMQEYEKYKKEVKE